eukprot:6090228-Amphidinium_carterae.1
MKRQSQDDTGKESVSVASSHQKAPPPAVLDSASGLNHGQSVHGNHVMRDSTNLRIIDGRNHPAIPNPLITLVAAQAKNLKNSAASQH